MKKTAILIMIVTLLSKILGFGREITMSYFYGASPISDAYFVAASIPTILLEFVGVGLATAYIPMMSKIENSEGKIKGEEYTSNLINIVCLVLLGVFLVAQLILPFIIKLFAAGFEGELLHQTILFSRITLISIFSIGLVHILSGFLQIRGNYVIPAMIGFAFNVIIIIAIIVSSTSSIFVLIAGTTIASLSQILFLMPWVWKKGFRHKFLLTFKDSYIRATGIMAIPVILGASANQINTLIDRSIASTITSGGISALNYASRLNIFIQSLFVMSLVVVMYPILSKMAEEKDIDGIKKSISESFGFINLLVIPITVGAMIFSEEVVTLLFGRGAFDANAIRLTSSALFFYSIGMLGFGYREVLSKTFYSLHDTKTPVINATIGVSINIILNFILSRYMGIGGLALATSISAIATAALMIVSLKAKIGPLKFNRVLLDFPKIVLASAVMGILARICYTKIHNSIGSTLGLAVAVGIGVIIYFAVASLMKLEEVENLKTEMTKKLKRSK